MDRWINTTKATAAVFAERGIPIQYHPVHGWQVFGESAADVQRIAKLAERASLPPHGRVQ